MVLIRYNSVYIVSETGKTVETQFGGVPIVTSGETYVTIPGALFIEEILAEAKFFYCNNQPIQGISKPEDLYKWINEYCKQRRDGNV